MRYINIWTVKVTDPVEIEIQSNDYQLKKSDL